MRLVVADTSPLVYLILIDQIEILPQLFESVILPDAVHAELCHRLAPAPVRTWAETLPSWAEVKPSPKIADDVFRSPGFGERAAIALALSIRADLVPIDERKGTQVAIENGLKVLTIRSEYAPNKRPATVGGADLFDTHSMLRLKDSLIPSSCARFWRSRSIRSEMDMLVRSPPKTHTPVLFLAAIWRARVAV